MVCFADELRKLQLWLVSLPPILPHVGIRMLRRARQPVPDSPVLNAGLVCGVPAAAGIIGQHGLSVFQYLNTRFPPS